MKNQKRTDFQLAPLVASLVNATNTVINKGMTARTDKQYGKKFKLVPTITISPNTHQMQCPQNTITIP
jgi:hypothetical protein